MLPQWFLISLIAPLIWALNYHIDKISMSRLARGVDSVLLAIVSGLSGIITVVLILVLNPSRMGEFELAHSWPALVAGFCSMMGLCFYYIALRKEEVTRIAALYSFSPVVAIIFGTILLGEQISPLHIVGICIVVAGGVLIDSRIVKHIFRINWQAMILTILSCFGFILGSVGFKKSAEFMGFWDVMLLFLIGSFVTSFIMVTLPKNQRRFRAFFRTEKRKKLFVITVISSVIGTIGRIAHNYAILLVPIAFVQTVEAFESAFVLLSAMLLMKFFKGIEPENLSRKVLRQKALSIVIIIAGSLMLTI